jgi:biopolymer transport protein ExbD
VFLRGDGGVTLQQLMEVMDRLKEGGVEKVGIVSRLPGER